MDNKSDSGMENISVVLCRVEGSINVGAVCRAVKAMGITKLVFANCPKFDDVEIRTYALGAYDIYENAKFFDTLDEALKPFTLVAGLTRRTGQKRKENINIEDFVTSVVARNVESLAVVFGNEKNGLNDFELSLCDEAVRINTSELFPSLNLSHAVQLTCWELRKAMSKAVRYGSIRKAASREVIDESVEQMIYNMKKMGFFTLSDSSGMKEFLRTVSARALLTKNELKRLEAVFSECHALVEKNKKQ